MDGNEGVSLNFRKVSTVYENGKEFFHSVVLMLILSLITSVLFNIYWGISIIIWFALGGIAAWYLVRNGRVIAHFVNKYKKQSTPVRKKPTQKMCTVCDAVNCRRHNPEMSIGLTKPWLNQKVPQEVDAALEEILNLIIERHIYSWYSALSTDDSFVQEIRVALRFLASSLLRRALQVDLVQLITVKLANALFQHLECYLQALKYASSPREVEVAYFRYLNNHKHVAIESREAELSYLRQLTENLLPYIVQKKHLQCRSACCLVREIFCNIVFLPIMDIVADPDIVNHLLLIFFDKTPMVEYPDSDKPKVEFLSNFVNSHESKCSRMLHTDLKTVLQDQSLLYLFMSFLKEECSINVLQFLLAVDDFNSVILNPDLSQSDLEMLHLQAQDLYNTYFSPSSPDQINFSEEVIQEFKELISGSAESVIRLRTTTPLFQAYDHAYGLLERVYCPMFFQSDKYFHLICGERCCGNVNKNSTKGNKRGTSSPSPISKLGNKIKGVFVTNIDEGQACEQHVGTDLAEALFAEEVSSLPQEGSGDIYRMDNDPRLKKLSAWRVFIPRVVTGMDQSCKYYYAFDIEVQRIDVGDNDNPEDLHWKIERKYIEFYVLETKLTEFHGELPVQLPPKKSTYQKGMQFLESRRVEFQKFLQTLLTLPLLQGSELLYTFLRTPIPFTSSFLPDIKLGKMIKTVPRKLMKEKGQHLLPFLQAFLASTEAAKPKPSKLDWNQINDYASTSATEKLIGGLFNDNLASLKMNDEEEDLVNMGNNPESVLNLDELYDYVYYIAVEVVHVQDWIAALLNSCDTFLRQPLQAWTEWYLDLKLQQVFKPQRLTEILNLIRDVLFFDDDPPRTRRQKLDRCKLAYKQVKEYFPGFLQTQKLDKGLTLLFDGLQCPLLNKQLSYVLLDIAVLELFPELQEVMHNCDQQAFE